MDILENPNYYIQDRPYKSKYICCECRKTFKRKVASDVKGIQEDIKLAKCPECGNETTWIGPKFKSPKTTNLYAWKSIEVLSSLGLLTFIGFANDKTIIPESEKALKELLISIKGDFEMNIRRWLSADYNVGNSEQIGHFSKIVKLIDERLKK